MGWLIALDVVLWGLAVYFIFFTTLWTVGVICVILASLLLLAISGGKAEFLDIFDIFN